MIEGRRVLPIGRKPLVLEYNRGGIATHSYTPVVVFVVAIALISVIVVGAKLARKYILRSSHGEPHVECFSDISALTLSLDSFEVDVGRYPTSHEGLAALYEAPPGTESRWRGPYLKQGHFRDPWGHPYLYYPCLKAPHDSYRLVSCGPDGIEGTADDVVSY